MIRLVSKKKKMTIPEPLTTLALSFVFVMVSEEVQCQPNPFDRPNFRSLLDFKEYEAEAEEEECRVGGNFCQNGGTCTKLKPNDVRVLSSSNEMIYRLQLAALSSTEDEKQRILGFRCTCASGFEGEFCQTRTLSAMIPQPHAWVICIVVAVVICLLALIITIVIYRNRSKLRTNDEWGLVKTPTGELEKVRLQHRVVDGEAYVMLDQTEAEKNQDDEDGPESTGDGSQTDGQQTTATGSVDASQQTYSADYDTASTQLSQHSDVASSRRSEIRHDPAENTSDPFDVAEEPGPLPISRSTLTSDIAHPEKMFTPDPPATPDEVWENDLVYKEPFFTQSVLLTSNRSSDEANDQENANPLGLGRAYSFVDDSVKPLMDDTTPRTYEGQFHYDADFSETNSQVIPNAQPVGIAEQRHDYEEYYDRGSPQATEVSEKPQFDRNVRQSRSLDQLQLRNYVQPNDDDSLFTENDQSHEMTELSEPYGSDQPTQRSESVSLSRHAEQSPSFSIPVDSRSYQDINLAQTSNNPQKYDDVYEDQSFEHSNIQRSVHFSESQKNSHTQENVQPYKNRENRQTYYQIGEELEYSQINQPVQPVRYSENSQYYNKGQERAEDDQLLQHHTLSTILENVYSNETIQPISSNGSQFYNNAQERAEDQHLQRHHTLSTILESVYSDETIQPTSGYEKLPVSHSAQQLTGMQEESVYEENEEFHQQPQPTDVPEISQSNQSFEQNQHMETLETYATQPRISPGDGLHGTASFESALDESSRDLLTTLTRSETRLKPRKSMSSESNQTKVNQSSNSNTLKEQLELQKGRPTTVLPVQPDQLVSVSAEAFHSLTDINAPSENQNRSNLLGSLSAVENVDRAIPSLPSDTVVPSQVKVELPTVARQAKKGEKDKSNRNRNKSEIRNRSNPWSLISGKPWKPDKKKEASSSRNTVKSRPEKSQQKRKQPNDIKCNATHKSDNNSKRFVEKAIDQKTLEHQELPVTTNQNENASNGRASEMTKSKNELVFTGCEDKHKLESLQQSLENACCNQMQSEREQTKEQLFKNAVPEQQLLEKVQNEHQLLDKSPKDQQLFDQTHNTKLPLGKLNNKRKQFEQPRLKKQLKESAQEEEQLLSKSRPLFHQAHKTKSSLEKLNNERERLKQPRWKQLLKESAQEEEKLLGKSRQLLDKTYDKQNERQEQLRIEKAHKEHQLREKARKDQLRFEKAQKQLLHTAAGKEQQRLEETPAEKLQLENTQQEHRRFESAKKECRGYMNAQREQTRLRNSKEELQRSKNTRLQQQQLFQEAEEEVLRFENADEKQLRSDNFLEERHRFQNALEPHICLEYSQMTHQPLEQTQSEEQQLEKASDEEFWYKDEREEKLRFKNSLNERLMLEISQRKLSSFKIGQEKHRQFDNFQKEDPWFKNGQRERLQLDNLQKEAPSPQSGQKEHLRFDILPKKDLWLRTEQREHSLFDNLQRGDPSPQNGQREHLRFENVRKKFPWPENTQQEHLQFDILQRRNLCLKSEQEEEQNLRFDNLQKKFTCSQNGQREQIRFDASQRERVSLENTQKDEQRSQKTVNRQTSDRLRPGEEEIQENIHEQSRGQGQSQQKHLLWTSHSLLSIRLRKDVSSSSSQRRSYSDVALALKDSLENLNNACSSTFKYGTRFSNVDNNDDSSEWDTVTERTAESDLELEEELVVSSTSSSGKVNLKSNGCEPVRCPAVRGGVDVETRNRSSEPTSTTTKVWKSSKSEFPSNDLSTALMDELRDYLARYRLRVATSSNEVLNEND